MKIRYSVRALLRPAARVLALCCIVGGLAACGDDDPIVPDGPEGTWVVQTVDGPLYIRVTADDIDVFSEAAQCFDRDQFTIISSTGSDFSLQDEEGAPVSWTLERSGDDLLVDMDPDDDVDALTLALSTEDVDALDVCMETGDFPHVACNEYPAISMNGSRTGALELGDARWSDGTWIDVYSLQVATTTDVNITLEADPASELDTYLMLYDADAADRIASDDDIDDTNFNSRVQTTLEPGCYIIIANGYSGDDEGEVGGDYTLSVSDELVSDFPHETCTAIPEVTVDGGAVTGRLEDGDPVWSDGSYYDLWSLQLDSEETVQITEQETDGVLDTYLMLYNSLGTLRIAENDDIDYDGGNYNSRVTETLAAGCYIIVATSYSDEPSEAGDYSLTAVAQ